MNVTKAGLISKMESLMFNLAELTAIGIEEGIFKSTDMAESDGKILNAHVGVSWQAKPGEELKLACADVGAGEMTVHYTINKDGRFKEFDL